MGTTVTFSVGVATLSSAVSYQWFHSRGDIPLSDGLTFTGTTTNTLTTVAFQKGVFIVRVSIPTGVVIESLTVFVGILKCKFRVYNYI